MKKWYCITLCILIGALTAFGQTAEVAQDSTGTASSVNETPDVSGKESSVVSPAAEESPAEPITGTDSESSVPSTEAVTGMDSTVVQPAPSTAASVNGASESAGTETASAQTEDTGDKKVENDDSSIVEMNEPTQRTKKRPLSMSSGVTVDATAANNVVSIPDFFKPELVIDFNTLSKEIIKSGIHANVLFGFDWFFQFTVREEHTIKLSTTINADGWTNVSKSLVDLIAKGNAANARGETIKGALNAKLNAFVDTGIMYQLKKPVYSFSARLAYFVPLAYMENPQAAVSLSPKKSGGEIIGLTMKAEGTANIYGYLPAMAAGRTFSPAEFFKKGGLDLSLMGSYRPTEWVTVTGGVHYLPLMTVQMRTGMQSRFKYEGTVDNLLNAIGDKNKKIFDQDMKADKLSDNLPQKNIMRPCKIQIGADFRPLQNDYLILSPSLAFPVINAKPYYVDGGLKIESRFAKVLGVYLDTGCIERMWRHELCFFIDSRVFTLNLAASLASQDFRRTFTTLSGFGIKFGASIGF